MPETIFCRMLTRSLLVVVILAATGACTSRSADESQSKADQPATSGTSTEQALLALENAWPQAVVKRDTATFERTLAPRFVYTEDSVVINRGDLIKGMASGPDTVESGGNEDMKVHDFGNNTAVVTGVLVLRGRGKDAPFTRRYRYTDTWMFRDGRWQVVAAQDYLIPK
jgi:ketosteroid isomerase-like protein